MAATVLFANNASTTLAGAITNSSLTANLASGTGVLFPSPGAGQYFVGTFTDAATGLLNEIVWVTNITGDVITMTRAQEGTTAKAWHAGDFFANLWTAGQAALLTPGSLPAPVFITATGSWTQTIPAGVSSAKVTIGAGGGGGGGSTSTQAGGGGGGGATGVFFLTAIVSGQSLSGVIGLGGTAGPSGGGTAGNGGNTTLLNNAVLIATAGGGTGGASSPSSAYGGAGGAVTLGTFGGTYIPYHGGQGTDGFTGGTTYGGIGAPGWLGAGQGRAAEGGFPGQPATSWCAGGGACYGAAAGAGGVGYQGFVLIEWLLN